MISTLIIPIELWLFNACHKLFCTATPTANTISSNCHNMTSSCKTLKKMSL
jgi:hypothetical protein